MNDQKSPPDPQGEKCQARTLQNIGANFIECGCSECVACPKCLKPATEFSLPYAGGIWHATCLSASHFREAIKGNK